MLTPFSPKSPRSFTFLAPILLKSSKLSKSSAKIISKFSKSLFSTGRDFWFEISIPCFFAIKIEFWQGCEPLCQLEIPAESTMISKFSF